MTGCLFCLKESWQICFSFSAAGNFSVWRWWLSFGLSGKNEGTNMRQVSTFHLRKGWEDQAPEAFSLAATSCHFWVPTTLFTQQYSHKDGQSWGVIPARPPIAWEHGLESIEHAEVSFLVEGMGQNERQWLTKSQFHTVCRASNLPRNATHTFSPALRNLLQVPCVACQNHQHRANFFESLFPLQWRKFKIVIICNFSKLSNNFIMKRRPPALS